MEFTDRSKATGGLLLLCLLTSGLFVLHIGHALLEGESLRTFLLGILTPLLLTVGLLLGTAWLWQSELDGAALFRVGFWSLGGGIAFMVGAVFLILYEGAEGVAMNHSPFIVGNAISAGALGGLIVGVYDVRQRIAQTRAEQLSQRLTVLNRIIRHDIRNRANVIHGRAEFIADASVNQDQIGVIKRQAIALAELSDNARSIEHFLHEREERQRVDICSLLDVQLDQLKRDYPATAVQASLPANVFISAHPLVEVAVENILENAVEHNDTSSPRVTVDCSRKRRNGEEYLEIRISDNGPGIPDQEIKVLDRGYETPLDHTQGFGLWLVKWIIDDSTGEVWFEENTPRGSTVCLRFEAASDHTPAGSSSA